VSVDERYCVESCGGNEFMNMEDESGRF